jgi:Family of unknown function (DUF6311)
MKLLKAAMNHSVVGATPLPAFLPKLLRTMSPPRRSSLAGFYVAAALGAIAFMVTVGYRPLIGSNIAWLQFGDAETYFLGWGFFRLSPLTLPPGMNPLYGLELGSSIYFTDSIPLLAIPLKLFAPLLGEPFQYFGDWLFVCFVLQAISGWSLIARFTSGFNIRMAAMLLFLFAPPFLARTFEIGHYPLSAHFPIIFALFLYGNNGIRRPSLWWPMLVGVASVIQSYIFVMVAVIWISDLVRRLLDNRASLITLSLLCEGVIVIGISGALLWCAGFFSVSSGLSDYGFGVYRANLVAPFDAGLSHNRDSVWSYFWPTIEKTQTEDAGTNFLGTGTILVLALAVLGAARRPRDLGLSKRFIPLYVAVVGMVLFSISHRISIGPHEVTLPIPHAVERVANLLRASERFMWPALYGVLTLSVVIVARVFGPHWGAIIVCTAAVVQLGDTSIGWLSTRNRFDLSGASWTSPLQSRFWIVAARQYQKVRVIPPSNHPPNYDIFAYYALSNRLGTDAVYHSRLDGLRLTAANISAAAQLREGRYPSDSLFILEDSVLVAAQQTLSSKDLLARVDGFLVIAPGWFDCTPCKEVDVASLRLDRRDEIGQR